MISCLYYYQFYRCALHDYVYPQQTESNTWRLELDSDNALLIEHGHKLVTTQMANIEDGYFSEPSKKYLTDKQTIVDYFLAIILIQLEKSNLKLDGWPNTFNWLKEFKPEVEKVQALMV